ncbi:MAG: translation initiation factor IF-2, partial [Candidatus Nanohaloarchaea archaeon]
NTDGDKIGRIKSVQEENESVQKAVKGDEVAVSVANATVGRDFEEGETMYTDLNSDDYQRLQQLEDLLGQGEKNVLQEIVDIKDSKDPHWKLG